jgi:hypothetical protein
MGNKTTSVNKIECIRQQTVSYLQSIMPCKTPKCIRTNDLALYLGVRPGTIRRSLCVNGHYAGLVPTKLNNGRLMWTVA